MLAAAILLYRLSSSSTDAHRGVRRQTIWHSPTPGLMTTLVAANGL